MFCRPCIACLRSWNTMQICYSQNCIYMNDQLRRALTWGVHFTSLTETHPSHRPKLANKGSWVLVGHFRSCEGFDRALYLANEICDREVHLVRERRDKVVYLASYRNAKRCIWRAGVQGIACGAPGVRQFKFKADAAHEAGDAK